jgi:hypothetical protein
LERLTQKVFAATATQAQGLTCLSSMKNAIGEMLKGVLHADHVSRCVGLRF